MTSFGSDRSRSLESFLAVNQRSEGLSTGFWSALAARTSRPCSIRKCPRWPRRGPDRSNQSCDVPAADPSDWASLPHETWKQASTSLRLKLSVGRALLPVWFKVGQECPTYKNECNEVLVVPRKEQLVPLPRPAQPRNVSVSNAVAFAGF
jgi:hypothetical protein